MTTTKTQIYVDVTHTWGSNLQTGMQKVVRQLCKSWGSDEYNINLIVFEKGCYRILPKSAFFDICLVDSNVAKNEYKKALEFKLRKANRLIIPLLNSRIRGIIYSSSILIKLKNFFSKTVVGKDLPVLDPQNCKILILELIFDIYHLDYILDCAESKDTELIFFCYDLIPVNHSQYCPPEFTIMFRRYLEIARSSKKLWSISKSTKNELETYVSDKSVYKDSSYQWLPPSSYPDCSHVFPFDLKSEEKGYLLFVGSFEPRKNHIGLLNSLEKVSLTSSEIPQICFVGGSSWDDGPIERKLEELRLLGFDLVKLLNIDECCIGKLFKEARLTLYPSHFEGFGLPVVESLSFGTPVLTTRIGSTEELLDLPGSIGVSPKNVIDIAEKLERFLTDLEYQENLKFAAEANMNSFRSWDDYARDLYSFISK